MTQKDTRPANFQQMLLWIVEYSGRFQRETQPPDCSQVSALAGQASCGPLPSLTDFGQWLSQAVLRLSILRLRS